MKFSQGIASIKYCSIVANLIPVCPAQKLIPVALSSMFEDKTSLKKCQP